MNRQPTKWLITLGLAVAAVACGGSQPRKSAATPGDTLTERQRDSMLAGSRIPGARGVGAAMRVADSTTARIRASDSVAP